MLLSVDDDASADGSYNDCAFFSSELVVDDKKDHPEEAVDFTVVVNSGSAS